MTDIDKTKSEISKKRKEIREGIEYILSHSESQRHDEAIAGSVMAYLHAQDVVIKVDRELPVYDTLFSKGVYLSDLIRAKYTAVEPLIETP